RSSPWAEILRRAKVAPHAELLRIYETRPLALGNNPGLDESTLWSAFPRAFGRCAQLPSALPRGEVPRPSEQWQRRTSPEFDRQDCAQDHPPLAVPVLPRNYAY